MAIKWTPLQDAFCRLQNMELEFRGRSVKLHESEEPRKCPHCGGKMDSYQHMGCDGDFCFGIAACSAHPLEVYPYAIGPH